MTSSDWISIVGTVASLAGLVFSWFAWREAGRAKNAAREAVVWVRKRNLAQEVLRLSADAKEFLNAVQAKERDKAAQLATDLAHRLMVASNHRAFYLPENFSPELCVENLRKVSVKLISEGFPEGNREMANLLRRCHQIHEALCNVAGKTQSLTEGAER